MYFFFCTLFPITVKTFHDGMIANPLTRRTETTGSVTRGGA